MRCCRWPDRARNGRHRRWWCLLSTEPWRCPARTWRTCSSAGASRSDPCFGFPVDNPGRAHRRPCRSSRTKVTWRTPVPSWCRWRFLGGLPRRRHRNWSGILSTAASEVCFHWRTTDRRRPRFYRYSWWPQKRPNADLARNQLHGSRVVITNEPLVKEAWNTFKKYPTTFDSVHSNFEYYDYIIITRASQQQIRALPKFELNKKLFKFKFTVANIKISCKKSRQFAPPPQIKDGDVSPRSAGNK